MSQQPSSKIRKYRDAKHINGSCPLNLIRPYPKSGHTDNAAPLLCSAKDGRGQANAIGQESSHRLGWRGRDRQRDRSEEHTSELQSLMRISYAVFCLKKKTTSTHTEQTSNRTIKDYTTTHTHTNIHNQHYQYR